MDLRRVEVLRRKHVDDVAWTTLPLLQYPNSVATYFYFHRFYYCVCVFSGSLLSLSLARWHFDQWFSLYLTLSPSLRKALVLLLLNRVEYTTGDQLSSAQTSKVSFSRDYLRVSPVSGADATERLTSI